MFFRKRQPKPIIVAPSEVETLVRHFRESAEEMRQTALQLSRLGFSITLSDNNGRNSSFLEAAATEVANIERRIVERF